MIAVLAREDWNYTTTRPGRRSARRAVDAIGGALAGSWRELPGTLSRHQMRDRQGRICDTEYGHLRAAPAEERRIRPSRIRLHQDTENPYLDDTGYGKARRIKYREIKRLKTYTLRIVPSTDSIPFRESAAARPPERKGRDAMPVAEICRSIGIWCLENNRVRPPVPGVFHLPGGPGRDRGADGGDGLRQAEDHPDRRRRTFPTRSLRSRFLKLDQLPTSEFVMECLQNNTTEVRNMKQIPADRVVQCAHHHQQLLHRTSESRYERRRLVRAAFSHAKGREQHEPDGNF